MKGARRFRRFKISWISAVLVLIGIHIIALVTGFSTGECPGKKAATQLNGWPDFTGFDFPELSSRSEVPPPAP